MMIVIVLVGIVIVLVGIVIFLGLALLCAGIGWNFPRVTCVHSKCVQ
jgi:hypothetical protein